MILSALIIQHKGPTIFFQTLKCFSKRLFTLRVFVAVAVVWITVSASSSFYETASGRQVPTFVLARLFGNDLQDTWHARIYELTSGNSLVTSVSRISLADVPYQSRLFKPEAGVSVDINGKRQSEIELRYLSKSIDGYSVYYKLDKTPFSLTLNGTLLRPLDLVKHPGIFIDLVHDKEAMFSSQEAIAIPGHDNWGSSDSYNHSKLQTSCRRNDPQLLLQLALAFDSSMCDVYLTYDYTLAALTDSMYMSWLSYHRQTCIRFKIVYYEGFCAPSLDPYLKMVSREDSLAMMNDLRLFWYRKREHVSRDLVYLITTRGSNTVAIGHAYMGAVCNKRYNVAWTRGPWVSTMSRQIAHAFNAPETTNGDIMTRHSNLYGSQYFSEDSLVKMETFIGLKGKCLSAYNRKQPVAFPNNMERTCKSSVDGFQLVYHGWINVANITFNFNGGTAVLRMFTLPSTDEILIGISLTPAEYRIVKYRRRLAMQKLRKKELGEWVDLTSSPSIRVWSPWTWSEIERPPSMATCCGNRLFTQVQVKLCDINGTGQCLTEFAVGNNRLNCFSGASASI